MAPKPRPPVPNPYSVDYSPTDRAICKGCDGRIAADSVRFLRKVWSPWHDGFDQQKYHLRCGFKFTSHLSEVRGWQALRWEDVMKVVVKFGETIDEKNPVVQKYKKRSSCVWALVDLLKELPKKQLLPILDANEIFYNEVKISALEAALIIADGILFGRFPPCPLCDTRALLQEGCEIRCRGYMPNSSMRCSFRFILDDLLRPSRKPDNSATGVDASSLERKELFILPPEAQRVPSLKGWKPPTDAPEVFKLGNPMSGQK
ncbi:nad(+) adp [Cystoisospora suis]|uniref:Nad(+) adp n=1 Tax=Cystoisospora suis TaxID=483139 RepID=A0A2C6L5E2_9APIC|nr:nad(+) adp [Cystoisospora suis]